MASLDGQPVTEERHPGTIDLDRLSALEFARLMSGEDARVAVAVAGEAEAIATAIDGIATRMQSGGRLIYIGAGTSGRLAVLDASECPATFGTPPELVRAVMAGGLPALVAPDEDAEDDEAAAAAELRSLDLTAKDSVVGISASGRTRFVIGGLREARARGALVIALCGTRGSPIAELAEIAITPVVGPEVLAGSTRLKAGTAQKMVLNTLSTGVMIRLGKTFGNLMVDVSPKSEKLRERARRIVEDALGLSAADADALLQTTGGNVKVAIVAGLAGVDPGEARRRLEIANGVVRAALETA